MANMILQITVRRIQIGPRNNDSISKWTSGHFVYTLSGGKYPFGDDQDERIMVKDIHPP